jgi:nitrate reductase gamma subunit
MVDAIFYFITTPMVYLAFAWCLVGIVINVAAILRAPRAPYSLKIFPAKSAPGLTAAVEAFTMPAVRRNRPVMWAFLIAFHLGLLGLLLGHLDLLPQIRITPAASKHMLGHGAIGVVVTIAALYFLFRRFRSPVREISAPADYLLLFLLFLAFLTGDTISWANSWNPDGFVLTKQDFGAYLNSLAHFSFANPRTFFTGSHYVVLAAHVLLANLLLLVLPFSKIMHTFFAVPLNALRRQ